MIYKNSLARHAAMLLRLARVTADPDLAAALISKAADLKTRIDEVSCPDVTPPTSSAEPVV
jgi:hypothetical protein